ncbi:probable tRNA N6-adenosine threonylcarbamoyltransferase, mitochondrial [Sitodiplosis mosellana]|uniref:probable tRNA N6-adenosine threonylcarbamoyltransferase, mitochondrial n=1 Tax=Sitodiplosis mosellana TaxID=263140 RepID=UPI0024437E7C|nr:probable tRNA N6-adenosine threonylcarbamoyltransferase, mitochondrial [Sitodiplosis mosellana]
MTMLRKLLKNFDKKLYFNQLSLSTRLFCNQSNVPLTESKRPAIVLGIETSCDDTGCAIVNSTGTILGESLHSQLQFHNKCGGINPPIAQEFHRKHIEPVVTESLSRANLSVNDVDAIAVASRPGLTMSLVVGVRYAKHLARKYRKPLIPIHHMEAHALMARLENQSKLNFPFLCLLASGGHCLLAMVKSVNDFSLLGEATDGSPGECFDKAARVIGLTNLPEYSESSGGRAIELEAYKATNADRFVFPSPLNDGRNCQFSFSGLKSAAITTVQDLQKSAQIEPDQLIPHHEDFCAGFLKATTKHIMRKTQRAIQYCERKGFFGFGANTKPRSLVFSGGVGCNDFIFRALSEMASEFGYKTFRPPKRLCTDNGVMIAWNGIERWIDNDQVYRELDIDSVTPLDRQPFRTNLVEDVERKNIQCTWIKVPSMQSNRLVMT